MENKHQKDLSHIRSMMERSSRFISLSGLSGICAGISALGGAAYAKFILTDGTFFSNERSRITQSTITFLVCDALIVLIISLVFGIVFTISKSKKLGLSVWTNTTKRVLFHLSIPLITGGIFCLTLIYYGAYGFIVPSTLIFYGLALISASKYTYNDVLYLGLCETVLGLISLFFIGHGLLFWTIGFGFLHIIYGVLLYRKYQ